MKIYLAARYSRRAELAGYAEELRALGHEVTSRWLNGSHEVDDDGLSAEAPVVQRRRFANEDWEDLQAAEAVIAFTEPPRSAASRGGRHVEFGAALAMGKLPYVVGYRENVFHCLGQVAFWETWPELLLALKADAKDASADESTVAQCLWCCELLTPETELVCERCSRSVCVDCCYHVERDQIAQGNVEALLCHRCIGAEWVELVAGEPVSDWRKAAEAGQDDGTH